AFKTPKGKLLKIPGVGEFTANAMTSSNVLQEAEKIRERADKDGHQLLFYTDKDYPERLKPISDAPTLLYYNGNANLNQTKIVSIVGTRRATEYGKDVTEAIVKTLLKHNVLVVSGLAYGIDIAAHRAALHVGLETVGVTAGGLDKLYPPEHRKTAEQMVSSGGMLTEHPYGIIPEAHNFPARNRIIAGMADALVVVEAAVKGGALISAEIANGYNKDVFAVPGNINNAYSAGCNKLIYENKAVCLADLNDLEVFMNWDLDRAAEARADGKRVAAAPAINIDKADADETEKTVLRFLLNKTEGVHVDELSRNSLVPMGKLANVLLQLEFRGYVKTLPGKKYALNSSNFKSK
ncbi:MAG: DNA-processing protein DprA, partial [Bacteroidota bacterium]